MRRGAVLAGALAAYVAYLVLGALLVAWLERPHEARLRAELEDLREQLLRRSPCVAAPALDAFVERVLAAGRLGRAALANASGPANASDPAWDFASALFFASTLVTTVGTCAPPSPPSQRGSGTPTSSPPAWGPGSLHEIPLSPRISPSPLWDKDPFKTPQRGLGTHTLGSSPPRGAPIQAFPPSSKTPSPLRD